MNRTHDRLHDGQAGAVGMMIIIWLVVVVLLGVTAIDAGSIAFTKFRLADVASSASTQAANAFRSSPNVSSACQAAEASILVDDSSAKLAKKGCVVDAQTGVVTITVRKEATTIIAGRLSFTKHFTKVSATETNGPTSL
ncbi:MAG: hypothetical protein ABI595_01500 [Actinomycetota bacterium]